MCSHLISVGNMTLRCGRQWPASYRLSGPSLTDVFPLQKLNTNISQHLVTVMSQLNTELVTPDNAVKYQTQMQHGQHVL